ncbi:hypothetical protein [Agromyces sp. NPDC058064]|uniref:hypothetical protein n=1 Tax=Agromyces sp. NPDC058064 TaxID=3346322 RepID=UPI0036DB3B4B
MVVVLCGPPGAGMSDAARASGLVVLDRDDPWWHGEAEFADAMRSLAGDRAARAVVVRAGATSSARAKASALCGATHVFVLTAPMHELRRRLAGRGRAGMARAMAGVEGWLKAFERSDGVLDFPGWDRIAEASVGMGSTSREW